MVVAVVIGLHTVGVVLMVSMLVAPAVAARQWTSNLRDMVILSASFGGMSGIVGSVISGMAEGMSTGPVIVVTATVMLGISFAFSPRSGYLPKYLRNRGGRTLSVSDGIRIVTSDDEEKTETKGEEEKKRETRMKEKKKEKENNGDLN